MRELRAAGPHDGEQRLHPLEHLGTLRARPGVVGAQQHVVEHGEEREQAPALEHVRVDACESCRRYLKTVDRSRLGLAVPLVDEVAGAPLDIWAQEHGYTKIELNLVGL